MATTHRGSARVRTADAGIQGLRTIAIIAMVAGHIIGAPDSGLRLPEDSTWRVANMWLELIRMPLFAALSGYVYALRPPVGPAGLQGLTRGKVRRLIVPLIVVGTLFYATQTLVPGTNNAGEMPLWRIYLFPYAHFWFLQSLFLIFLVVALLDAFRLLRDARSTAVALAVATAVSLTTDLRGAWNILSVDGAVTLLPFFLLGVLLCRHGQTLTRRRMVIVGVGVVAGVLLAVDTLLRLRAPDESTFGMDALAWVIGMLVITALISARAWFGTWRTLVLVGPFVFGIYLFHSFATAGTRILLQRLGMGDEIALVFLVSLVAGVTFPIALRMTAGRNRLLSWALFGERPYGTRPVATTSSPEATADSANGRPTVRADTRG